MDFQEHLLHRGLLAFGLFAGACSGADDDFQFERGDMEAAVHGDWTGTYTPLGGEPIGLSLTIRAPNEPARTTQCEGRSFSEASGSSTLRPACMSSSSLSVVGSLSLADGSLGPLEIDGWFLVTGLELDSGSLELPRAEGDWVFHAIWERGGFSDCGVDERGLRVANCELERDAAP